MGSIEELKADLKRGRIDRRTFMSGAVAMGLSVAAGMSVANAVAAGTPKRGGTLRIGLGSGSTTDNLDPITIDSMFNQVWSFGSLRNALTVIEADGSLKPELASSWETSDAKTWRFEIRKGVEFHNGKTPEPADVVASINYHRGADTKSGASVILKEVSDVKVDGQFVVITLGAANADFAFILPTTCSAFAPLRMA
ncbi:ABC transporter substrate-binding protein [Mesorhizobium sp. M0601]|uniref:ABC transporter substrate-binding protein n=1 Tax=Mesorhizobium sp. M0601 TaxID=2956969 RepID=UPI00333B2A4D